MAAKKTARKGAARKSNNPKVRAAVPRPAKKAIEAIEKAETAVTGKRGAKRGPGRPVGSGYESSQFHFSVPKPGNEEDDDLGLGGPVEIVMHGPYASEEEAVAAAFEMGIVGKITLHKDYRAGEIEVKRYLK